MPNRIFRGQIGVTVPKTLNLPVVGAYLPGIFVVSDGTQLTAANGAEGRVLVLGNKDFHEQSVNDAYVAGDTGIGYRPRDEDEYLVRFAAGSYTTGQALSIGATGLAKAAAVSDVVVAYFDQPDATLSANDFADVVIAKGYKLPAA
jgi:hypothetical protein